MKLFHKVYLSVVSVMLSIVVTFAYFRIEREKNTFGSDMQKDALLLGESLSGLIEYTWIHSGRDTAIKLLEGSNQYKQRINIRWVSFKDSTGKDRPNVPIERLSKVLSDEAMTVYHESELGELMLYTYIPILIEDAVEGAIELSEPYTPIKNYLSESIFRLISSITLNILFIGLALWFILNRLIEKPLNLLTEHCKTIASGKLDVKAPINNKGEFYQLSKTLDEMCSQLAESQSIVKTEHENKIRFMEQLRHTDRLNTLGQLSAGVAHEIGTPLNVISGYAQLIQRGDIEGNEVKETAGIIRDQVDRITKIVRSLLNFSRKQKSEKAMSNIQDVVGNSIKILTSLAREKKAVINVSSEGDIPLVMIDASQIHQVITNIVINGIQAMTGGGNIDIALKVAKARNPKLSLGDTRNYLQIQIKDEGPGIKKEYMDRIFEPFFTTKDVGSGTGLGLSIVLGIVEEHGGWIEVENLPVKGACFKIHLPLENK